MGFLDFIKNFISSGKKNTQIIADDFSKIYKDATVLEVALYSDNKPLTDKTIIIEINDVPYERKTNDKGIAKLNINLEVGKYKTLITFKGDDEYKSSKDHIDVFVNPIIETSDLTMQEKDGSKFIAILKGNDGKLLQNIEIVFDVNGVLYTRKTNEKGQASLNINLDQGQYIIKTIKNNSIKENKITIEKPKPIESPKKHFGYWIFGKDMLNVNLNELKNNNVTDVFLNYYAFNVYGEGKVLQWIKDAKILNINTHIWMQSFYDGEWHNPKTTNLSNKIEEAKKYANMIDVYGIHLDYLRYPGNAYKTDGGVDAINNFVQNVKNAIGNKFLSCAIMPESENIKYYGQDIEALGKIVDAVIPMQYKGNYSAGTSWLLTTSNHLSAKATIWSGLQSYKSDDDTTPLSANELNNDINTCLNNGAQGVILFRYGLSPSIKFPSQSNSSDKKETRMEGTNMEMTYQDGSKYQCAVYDNNGRVTGTVKITVNGVPYTRTPDNEGLYKLNINLNPGTYKITAEYLGDDTHKPSSIENTIVIKEKPKTETPVKTTKLYPFITQQGGGKLGQRTGYTCGPHSLMQCIYRLTGIELSEMELASVCGTTTNGTSHEGLATGLAWFNRKYGYNLKMTWKNKSELSWNEIQQIIDNAALFFHLLYRDQYGHYELASVCNTNPMKILNSLGSQCGNGYCGYIESRTQSTQQSYINGISQKSICIITRE